MIRCIIATVLCWVAMAVWLAWDSLTGTYFALEVYLSFVYSLVPLVPAAVLAMLLCHKPWWLRSVLAAATSCGIVIVFLNATDQFDLVAPLVTVGAGFVIGISASKRQQVAEQSPAGDVLKAAPEE